VRAIILAGGLGTRLRAVVRDRPKAMSPVGGRPFLELLLEQLRRHGVPAVTIAVGYGGDYIRRHIGEGAAFGIDISYSDDGPELLGTGGALARAVKLLSGNQKDPVLVLNGDTYLEYQLEPFLTRLAGGQTIVVLGVVRVEDAARYGSVSVNRDGSVLAFHEKGSPGPGLINAGVYCACRETWSRVLPQGGKVSLEREVLPQLVGSGLCTAEINGLFVDIGVPADYHRAQALLKRQG
jgi:D-glycero-alpha-D-manno-heptose 1-phosphate guanylyltransferase